MSDGALTVLDGTLLRFVEPHRFDTNGAVKGTEVLELADAAVSSKLFGLSLPESFKSNALKRIKTDAVTFGDGSFNGDDALSKFLEYVNAIADELSDDPIAVAVLDGKMVRDCLEDEDDFAMLAENLFTELDGEDRGKVGKSEIIRALDLMGIDMGIPPISEFPGLNDILKKHGALGAEMLGQAQFAELLQHILQDLANELAADHIVFIRNIRVINGSKLRKLLADEIQLESVIHEIFKGGNGSDRKSFTERMKLFLGKFLDLPSSDANESVSLFYDLLSSEVDDGEKADELEIDEFEALVKEGFVKSAAVLDGEPIIHNSHT
ncbi:hypothetical protein Scep_009778 [Stephania cephalantha]|uniref:EF-hand domain-containing protein n=1 Tax=Stephania cephalantha TaxID=152367 RepID=A0AAP0JTV9_9MAGN